MALGQDDARLSRTAFWWTGGCIYLFWNLSTLAGAIGASALGDPRRFGLDAAIPAAFLALLLPQLKVQKPDQLNSTPDDNSAISRPAGLTGLWHALGPTIPVAILAAVIAAVLIPLTPPGVPVLTAGAALVLLLIRRREPA